MITRWWIRYCTIFRIQNTSTWKKHFHVGTFFFFLSDDLCNSLPFNVNTINEKKHIHRSIHSKTFAWLYNFSCILIQFVYVSDSTKICIFQITTTFMCAHRWMSVLLFILPFLCVHVILRRRKITHSTQFRIHLRSA